MTGVLKLAQKKHSSMHTVAKDLASLYLTLNPKLLNPEAY